MAESDIWSQFGVLVSVDENWICDARLTNIYQSGWIPGSFGLDIVTSGMLGCAGLEPLRGESPTFLRCCTVS